MLLYGVGKKDRLDYQGRNILFSKGKQKRFPSSREISDKLIFIIAMYGFDTFVFSKAQSRFKDDHKELFAKPWINKHDHPCVFAEDIKPPDTKRKEKFDDEKLICTHNACGAIYTKDKNEKGCCSYHPGRYEFGSVHVN